MGERYIQLPTKEIKEPILVLGTDGGRYQIEIGFFN